MPFVFREVRLMVGIAFATIITFLLDRISKVAILKYVFNLNFPDVSKFGKSVPLIKDVFHLTYHGNTGMAFGMFKDNKLLLIVLCAVILGLIVFYIYKTKPSSFVEKMCYGMIIGGALGNVFDRITYGFVIDFLDVCVINYPIFNVADSFIVIGTIILAVYILFFEKGKDKFDKV